MPELPLSLRDDSWSASAVAGILPELAAKRVLDQLGLHVVTDVEVTTAEEAAEAWASFGGPVAVKLQAPGIAHKAALGGVRLGVQGAGDVADAARAVLSAVPADLSAQKVSVLVEPMVAGVEAFLGVSRNEDFGPVAVIGLGGVDVEQTGQVASALLPVSSADVRRMMQRSGLTAALGTVLAESVAAELARALDALTPLIAAPGAVARSVDVNPLMVTPDGACIAVDALIEVDPTTTAQRRVG